MVENVAFATTVQDNFEYLLNDNARLRRQLIAVKQHARHIAAKNQRLSSHNFNTAEW